MIDGGEYRRTEGVEMRGKLLAAVAVAFAATTGSAHATTATYSGGPITNLTTSCAGQNAEVEQAVDAKLGYAYEDWMGCSGIGFARSIDGGKTWGAPTSIPGATGSDYNAWDPAIAVGPDGTVYAAFMRAHNNQWYPVVAASFDHGQTFSQISSLAPPDFKNWGDRDFIEVGPDGTVYLTYDYGPNRSSITFLCAADGSCGYASGDVNVVLQKSTDHGKTWSSFRYVSPGFPASGGDLAPFVVEPNGALDVIYQGYGITDTTTYAMTPAYEYFTRSTDGGDSWTRPVKVGAEAGTMSLSEWWIDSSIGIDSGGNLYVAWDTQADSSDTGWLSYSTNRGKTWSPAIQATPDRTNAPHIMEVVGGPAGIAYVGTQSDSDPRGYATYLRAFSTANGWLSPPDQVSQLFGDPSVWPGDTFGINTLTPTTVVMSWGSAVPSAYQKKSDIFVSTVGVKLP
jgi:hypothetical protein